MSEKIFYTQAEADRLKDAVYIDYTGVQFPCKFVRRGRRYAYILIPASIQKHNQGFPFVIDRKHVADIEVEGKRLEYLSSYEFTNPNNPFKTK